MKAILHPQAQSIIESFLAKGGQSFEQLGTPKQLRQIYHENCKLTAMQGLDHIATHEITTTYAGQPVHLRIYDRQLDKQTARPCVIYMHGGGWVIGNLDTHDSICRKIADTADVKVIAIDYRLAPEFKYPIPQQDCEAAVAYMIKHAHDLGIDVHHLVLCGDSAGAHLAAWIGQNFYQRFALPLKAQVLLYPTIGYFANSLSYDIYQTGFPLTAKTMHWFYSQLMPNINECNVLSLLNQPFIRENGDLYVLTVEHDPLRDEVLPYVQKAITSGLQVEYQHVQGLMHGMFTLAGKLPIAEHYLEKVSQFIQEKIK